MTTPLASAVFTAFALLLAGCATTNYSAVDHAQACRAAAESIQHGDADLRQCDLAVTNRQIPASARVASLVNRGILQMQAGNLQAAVADFDAVIGVAPSSAEAWINKGIALSRQDGQERQAVAILSHGIDLGPAQPAKAFFARAMAWESLGRAREAYEDYSRAAQLDPEWTEPGEQLRRFKVVRRKTASG